jgi:hypothetical protein
MVSEKEYPSYSMELEAEIREAYRDGLECVRESGDSKSSLEELASLFEILEKSSPCPERESEWAIGVIRAYRKLGRIYRRIIMGIETYL